MNPHFLVSKNILYNFPLGVSKLNPLSNYNLFVVFPLTSYGLAPFSPNLAYQHALRE